MKMLRQRKEQDEEVIKALGEGEFSFIRLCKIDNSLYVVKYSLRSRVKKWILHGKTRVPMEISILNELEHPNILMMEYFYIDEFFYKIVSKWKNRIDLFEYINTNEFKSSVVLSITKQILLAVEYIHSLDIAHLDIKDENFLIDDDLNVIMIDFGSSRYCKQGPFKEYLGTSMYEPPELISNTLYTGKEQDMWQIGVLFYIILFRVDPFQSQKGIVEMDIDYTLPIYPNQDEESCRSPIFVGEDEETELTNLKDIDNKRVSSFIVKIIKSLIVADESKRKTATEILACDIYSE